MTSRERVLAAVQHEPADRLPADFTALAEVREALLARLGVADQEELLQALAVDLRRIPFDYYGPETGPDENGYFRNVWGTLSRQEDPGDGLPQSIRPFDENSTVADVHDHQWPDPDALDYSGLRELCARYHGEYATLGAPWSPFFHEVGWLIGQEEFFIWMSTKPDVVQAIIDHLVDYEVECTRRYLQACAGLLDIAFFGNDFGTQRGLFISPAGWERFIRRPLKRFFDVSHEFGCLVMQHSCGSVRGILPQMIEDGVNLLDPVQVAAADMDLAGLMRDFGDRLTFHGGVDTQTTLPYGTPEEVRSVVRSYAALARQHGGGYILTGSQDLMPDIPLDNILAMYELDLRAL